MMDGRFRGGIAIVTMAKGNTLMMLLNRRYSSIFIGLDERRMQILLYCRRGCAANDVRCQEIFKNN
jgi:hypothetical protein